MMNIEVVSLLSIIFALAIMMYLAYKGLSLLLIGPIVSIIVLLASGMPIMENLTGAYSASVSGFVKNNFLMLLTASIFGSILGEAGAAQDIADALTSKIGLFKKGDKQFIALMILSVIFAILVYGGVSGFVVVFTMVPLCKYVFKQYDIPWHLYLAIHSFGGNLFAQVMLPGSPAIQNLMPMEYLGTTPMAAPLMGLGVTVYSIILAVIYIRFVLTRCQKKSETFLMTGAGINETIVAEDKIKNGKNKETGSFLKAIISPIVVLILLNIVGMKPPVALTVGSLLCIALYFKRFDNVVSSLGKGAKNGANTLITIASIVGFGGIVTAVPGYSLLTESLLSMPGSPLIQFVIAVNAVAAVSGSSSGGESIALETFGKKFLDMGYPPQVIHRVAAISCQGLDSLPHAGGVINQLETSRLSFKQGYIHIFIISALIPFTAGFFAVFLYSIGII
jgi:H+/gluconate symporter-like permease